MINEAKSVFSGMTPIEIVKEVAGCALLFAFMGVLVFMLALI